jgi:hypothetical protein
MAEQRSAEERIRLWYQQLDHALKMSKDQFYGNAMATYVQPELSMAAHVQRFQDAIDTLGHRVTYLQQNPAEVVQDRSEALAEQARRALRQAPVRDFTAELTPEERRVDEAIARVTDPDYLGEQAEERFYAEQDPNSQWYREDLYHGEPGPDVALDWAEQEARARDTAELGLEEPSPWDELSSHEQSEYLAQQLEDQAHSEPRLETTYPTQAQWLDSETLPIEIDTVDADMGQRWQAQLAALEARLDALTKDMEPHEQRHQQASGMER